MTPSLNAGKKKKKKKRCHPYEAMTNDYARIKCGQYFISENFH